MLTTLIRGVTVEIDATPSWWARGEANKYSAAAALCAESKRSGFRYATEVRISTDRVIVRAVMPKGEDMGPQIEALQQALEALGAEFAGSY